MRLLVTGICGFVGSTLARCFLEMIEGVEIFGIDSLIRPGSELNRRSLPKYGCKIFYGDVRSRSDLDQLPPVDWVIDAAANPSVSAGVDGSVSSRQLVEHNLLGTINVLEYCRHSSAGLILLSTSRVYSIPALGSLPLNTDREPVRARRLEDPPNWRLLTREFRRIFRQQRRSLSMGPPN